LPLCCAQDNTILESPIKVKKFLEKHNIAYEPGTPERVLRGKAKARMKSIRDEGISPEAKRIKMTGGNSLSVTALNEIVLRIRGKNEDVEKHYRVDLTIEELPGEFTVLKHESGVLATCKGKIFNGACQQCFMNTDGIPTYSYRAKIADIDDDKVTTLVTCAEGAGTTMFKMRADEFHAKTRAIQKDLMEKVMCIPMNAGVWIKYSKAKDDMLIVMYGVGEKDE